MEQYTKLVQEAISNQKRWDALPLIRDDRYEPLPQSLRNDLYDLEILAEESR